MARPLPDAVRLPITDLESGKAWVDALFAAELHFHFEDSPETIVEGGAGRLVFKRRDCPLIRDRIDALYALDWSPEGHECPIGYLLTLMEAAGQ